MNNNDFRFPAATAAGDVVPERFAAPEAATGETETVGTSGLTAEEIRRIVLDTVG